MDFYPIHKMVLLNNGQEEKFTDAAGVWYGSKKAAGSGFHISSFRGGRVALLCGQGGMRLFLNSS